MNQRVCLKDDWNQRGCGILMRGMQGAALLSAVLWVGVAQADVVLHPGTLTGYAGVTSPVFYPAGTVSAQSSSGDFYGSGTMTNQEFLLTTESGRAYDYFYTYQSGVVNGQSLALHTYYYDESVDLPLNGTASIDLRLQAGTVSFVLDITGGSVSSSTMSLTTFVDAPIKYSGYARGTTNAQVDAVMGPGTATASGSATLIVEDPLTFEPLCTTNVYFPNRDITVIGGQTTTVTYPVTLDTSICVQATLEGDVGLINTPDGVLPTQARVYSNGPTQVWDYQYDFSAADPLDHYSFASLNKGVYAPYAYLLFPSPHQTEALTLPRYNPYSVDLSAGGAGNRDFVFEGALAQGHLELSGPPAQYFTGALRYFSGKYEYNSTTGQYGEASGAWTSTNFDPQVGDYSVVLTEGNWLESTTYLSYTQYDANIRYYGSLRYTQTVNIVAAGGSTTQIPPAELSLSEAVILFDVIEPAGSPTIGISSPRVSAYYYDAQGNLSYSLDAYSNITNAPTPGVRLFGPAGTYSFSATASVNGTGTRFASSTVTLGQAVNTPAGTNVITVPPLADGAPGPVTLEFPQVTTGGQTNISFTDVGPAAPTDYELLPIIDDDSYMNISTSAVFPGPVEVCLTYDPDALGLSQSEEAMLELQQYSCVGTDCTWTVITGILPGGNGGSAVNTTTHTICGLTSSLSTFALTFPLVTSVPPTSSCIGLESDPIQRETDPGMCSLEIDNENQLGGGCADAGGGLMSCLFDGEASLALELGSHQVSVVGTADDGSSSSCTSWLSVVDREAPSIECSAATTVECTGATTGWTVGASCGDNCEDCDASCGAGPYPLGTSQVACNANDAWGNTSSCTTAITIVDTLAPSISVAASPNTLWPPNHKLVAVSLAKPTSDGCDSTPFIGCSAISNEPDNGLGDGDKPNDIQWIDGVLYLRAERSGLGTDRIYTITCTSTDDSGNVGTAVSTVTVPHDQ